MIKLVLNFITPINVLIFIFLSAAAGYWIFIRLRKRLKLSFFPVIALNTVLFLTWAITGRFYHDEAVHLHLSWLISKGLVPYKDFWFHHSPFLWTILAPWGRRMRPPAGGPPAGPIAPASPCFSRIRDSADEPRSLAPSSSSASGHARPNQPGTLWTLRQGGHPQLRPTTKQRRPEPGRSAQLKLVDRDTTSSENNCGKREGGPRESSRLHP